MELDNLPPWAIPAGIGGLIGLGVLMTRRSSPNPNTPVALQPVRGQQPGTVDPGIDMLFNKLGGDVGRMIENQQKLTADLIAANNKQQQSMLQKMLDELKRRNAPNPVPVPKPPAPGTTPKPSPAPTKPPPSTANPPVKPTPKPLPWRPPWGGIHPVPKPPNPAPVIVKPAPKPTWPTPTQNQINMWKAWRDYKAGRRKDFGKWTVRKPTTAATDTRAAEHIQMLKDKHPAHFAPKPAPTGAVMKRPNGALHTNDTTWYPTTGHAVSGPFRTFLASNGGTKNIGKPLSGVFVDDHGIETQVFNRAILKRTPNGIRMTRLW